MRFKLVIALFFAAAALAACSNTTPSTPAESAASTEALPPPDAEARATPEEASQDGGAAVAAPSAAAEAPAGEADSLPGAETGWVKEGVTQEQHRADIESCYAYAWSQVQRDLNIDSDIDSARFDGDDGLGVNQLTAEMDAYSAGNRRISLMNSCMEAKGYVRA
jgi:hypothetical protein